MPIHYAFNESRKGFTGLKLPDGRVLVLDIWHMQMEEFQQLLEELGERYENGVIHSQMPEFWLSGRVLEHLSKTLFTDLTVQDARTP